MIRSLSVSHLVVAVVALVLGVLVGGVGPRGEARALQQQLVELEGRECARGRGVGAEIAGAFRGRPLVFGEEATAAAEPAPSEPVAVPTRESSAGGAERSQGTSAGGGPDEVEAVMEAMELRRRQAMQALIDHGGLDAAQQELAEGVVDELNSELELLAEEFVTTMEGGVEPDRRESMLFARDAIDVLLDAENGLYDLMDESQREGLGPEITDPFNYIDGGVVSVLRELDRR